jgi:hypothetical protein
MVENAKKQLIRQDWQQVFEPENLAAQVDAIVHG